MVAIVDGPRLEVRQNGNKFHFTVTYTYSFSDLELTFPEGFAESMAVREDNTGVSLTGGDDDIKHGNAPIRVFHPGKNRETRQFEIDVLADDLDTEVGGEEIYCRVHFRRNIEGIGSQIADTTGFPSPSEQHNYQLAVSTEN